MEPDDTGIFLHFSIGGRGYALPIGMVSEVAALGLKSEVPGAPATVIGLGELRGRVLTLLDLERLLDLPPSPRPSPAPSVILAPPFEHIALPVDRILGIPALGAMASDLLPGVEQELEPSSGETGGPGGAGPPGGGNGAGGSSDPEGTHAGRPLADWVLDLGPPAVGIEGWSPDDSALIEPGGLVSRCVAEVRNRYRIPLERKG